MSESGQIQMPFPFEGEKDQWLVSKALKYHMPWLRDLNSKLFNPFLNFRYIVEERSGHSHSADLAAIPTQGLAKYIFIQWHFMVYRKII